MTSTNKQEADSMRIEESFYVVVLMQDLDYYAHLIAGITSDFSRNAASIQVLFQRFENTLRALTWLEKRRTEVELSETTSPTVLIIIDPVPEVISAVGTIQKGKSGKPNIQIIHRMFKEYSQVAYFHNGTENYAKSLDAFLISKTDVKRGIVQICKILSTQIEQRSHGGMGERDIYTMLLNRGIPIPPHLQQQGGPMMGSAQPSQLASSGFPHEQGSAELYEMKSQLLLIQERGRNAIDDLEELAAAMKGDQKETEETIAELRKELADLKAELFGGSLDTNDKSMIAQLMSTQQRVNYVQSEFKDYAKRIGALESGHRRITKSLGALAGDDDKGLATQVLAGLFALAKQKEYAFFLIALAFILVLSIGFNVSIADMADFVLKWKGE